MNKAGKLYTISANMANAKNISTTFIAAEIASSKGGAVYLYGHGTTDPRGKCCKCGKELTHPGSILIGIGPECLRDWGAREYRLSSLTREDRKTLHDMIEGIKIDGWFPISSIKHTDSSKEILDIPDDHPLLAERLITPKSATIDSTGKFVVVKFPYDPKTIEEVKRLEGRKWNPQTKSWTAWASLANLESLQKLKFEFDDGCKSLLAPLAVKKDTTKRMVLDIPGLYPFQNDGIRWLEDRDGRGLIADEMGLGKTVQALGYLRLHLDKRPAVIVVPASLRLNWKRETEKWIRRARVAVLSGTKPTNAALKGNDVFIINYDILSPWLETLMGVNPQVLIVDESHYIKNTKARRTKAVKELAKQIPHIIFLTGTPITNRPSEFFTTLNLLDPRNFSSWIRYTQKFCGAYNDGFGWNVSGATNTEELHRIASSTIMLRRKKADVLKDLPPKRRLVVPMDLTNKNEYLMANSDLIRWIKETYAAKGKKKEGEKRASGASQAEALSRFSYLKQLSSEGIIQPAIEWIANSLEGNKKIVVFAVHHTTIDRLSEGLRNFNPVVVDGRVPLPKRQECVDTFQNDPSCKVFIGNIKAAGVGLTLTAASDVVFVELGWTPGEHDQAEDRIHRIGQEESCNAWYLVAGGTIMEEIALILDEKRAVLDAVLDGKEVNEDSMLSVLLKRRMEAANDRDN